MNMFERCCRAMPADIRQVLEKHTDAEEIRLRCHEVPAVCKGGKEYSLGGPVVNEQHLLHILEVASGASMHSHSSSIASGFIEYSGLRIGICGQCIWHNGQLTGFRRYSSLSVRIPHECLSCIPESIVNELKDKPRSTLIAAPPGFGKTSALRELVRKLSNEGIRVALIDERGELSGSFSEPASFGIGKCTDILSALPKAEAAMILLRNMNPNLIAMDEITRYEDIDAVLNIIGCGVYVLATAHGRNLQDMMARPVYKTLFEQKIFDNLISISINEGKRVYSLERIS